MRPLLSSVLVLLMMALAGCAAPDAVEPAATSGPGAPSPARTSEGSVSAPQPVDEEGKELAPFVVDVEAFGEYLSVGVPGLPTVHYALALPDRFFVTEHTRLLRVGFEFSGRLDPVSGSPKVGYATAALEGPDGIRVVPVGATMLPGAADYEPFVAPLTDSLVFELEDPLPGEWLLFVYGQGVASYEVKATLQMEGFGEPPTYPGWKASDE